MAATAESPQTGMLLERFQPSDSSCRFSILKRPRVLMGPSILITADGQQIHLNNPASLSVIFDSGHYSYSYSHDDLCHHRPRPPLTEQS